MTTVRYTWPPESGICLRGGDAEAFLQGMVSCDVLRCNPERAVPGALLSVNGRVISDFTLTRPGEHLWILLPPPGQAQRLMQEFERPAALYRNLELQPLQQRSTRFERTDAADAAEPWSCSGNADDYSVALPAANGMQAVEHICTRPEGGDADSVSEDTDGHAAKGASEYGDGNAGENPADAGDWVLHQLRSGRFPVLSDWAEKFTAHALHLHSNGTVDFDKGCYRGQEIVIRTEHRGKVKRAMRLLRAERAVPVGTPVEQRDRSLGEVALCQPLPEGGALLVAQLPVDAQGDMTAAGIALADAV